METFLILRWQSLKMSRPTLGSALLPWEMSNWANLTTNCSPISSRPVRAAVRSFSGILSTVSGWKVDPLGCKCWSLKILWFAVKMCSPVTGHSIQNIYLYFEVGLCLLGNTLPHKRTGIKFKVWGIHLWKQPLTSMILHRGHRCRRMFSFIILVFKLFTA